MFRMTRHRTLVFLLLLLTLPLSGCDLLGTDNEDSTLVTDGVYVANQGNFNDGNGSVTLYNPNTGTNTTAVENLSSIVQSIALRNDRLYLTANSGGRLDVFDAGDQSQLQQLTGLSGPRYLTFTDDETAFLTSQQPFNSSDPDSIHAIDIDSSSPEITGSIEVPGTVEGITHTESRVYAALGGFSDTTLVAAIDSEDLTLTNTIDVKCAPRYVIADQQNDIFIPCTDESEVVVLDEVGNEVKRLALPAPSSTNSSGQPAFFVEEANELYVVAAQNRLVRINTAMNEVVTKIGPFEGDPIGSVGYDTVREEIYLGRFPSPPDGFTEQGTITIHERDGTQTGSFQAGVAPTFIDFRRSKE